MSRTIPERYVWAVHILDAQPGDAILEIGCGYGHSIPLVCEKLGDGRLTAIDRSQKMVEATSRNQGEFLSIRKARVLHQDLLGGALPASHFDKIFLFNINVFWMDPAAELAEIRRLLKPQGRFFLFHQPPPGHDLGEFENAFRTNLSRNDFLVVNCFKEQSEPIRSVAVISRANPQ